MLKAIALLNIFVENINKKKFRNHCWIEHLFEIEIFCNNEKKNIYCHF